MTAGGGGGMGVGEEGGIRPGPGWRLHRAGVPLRGAGRTQSIPMALPIF